MKTADHIDRLNVLDRFNVTLIHQPWVSNVICSIWFPVGSKDDLEFKAGISHLTEHLILRKIVKDKKNIIALERVGGWANAWTDKEYTYYFVKTPPSFLSDSLSLLLKTVFLGDFRQDDLVAEKNIVSEEINEINADPIKLVWDLWHESILEGTPLAHSTLGYMDTLKEISLGDLQGFFSSYYHKNRKPLILIIGNLTEIGPRKIENIIVANKHLFPRIITSNRIDQFQKTKVREFLNKTDTSSIVMGTRIPGFKQNQRGVIIWDLINTLVVSGWASVIPQTLRLKEGLIYNWYGTANQFENSGYYAIQISTRRGNASESQKLLERTLLGLPNKLTVEEIEFAKDRKINWLQANIESTYDFLLWLGDQELLYDNPLLLEDYIQAIESTPAKVVQEEIKKYFVTGKINTVSI